MAKVIDVRSIFCKVRKSGFLCPGKNQGRIHQNKHCIFIVRHHSYLWAVPFNNKIPNLPVYTAWRLIRFPFDKTTLHWNTPTSCTFTSQRNTPKLCTYITEDPPPPHQAVHSHHRGLCFQQLQPAWVGWHPQHYTALRPNPGSSPNPVQTWTLSKQQCHDYPNNSGSWLNPVQTWTLSKQQWQLA